MSTNWRPFENPVTSVYNSPVPILAGKGRDIWSDSREKALSPKGKWKKSPCPKNASPISQGGGWDVANQKKKGDAPLPERIWNEKSIGWS